MDFTSLQKAFEQVENEKEKFSEIKVDEVLDTKGFDEKLDEISFDDIFDKFQSQDEFKDIFDLPEEFLQDEEVINLQNDSIESKEIIIQLECRNQGLDGQEHPVTGVPFNTKIIEYLGEKLIGVFPEFNSKFDVKLDESQYKDSDAKHFKEANSQLAEGVEKNPSLKEKFTPEQLEDIANGDTPEGYVWHHSEVPGKLELVDAKEHAGTGHTGGRSIWGGGSTHR